MKTFLIHLSIARLDHWFKNIFVFPGFFLALIFENEELSIYEIFLKIILSLLAIGFTASANYTINEFLDSETDKVHPLKNIRPGAQGLLNPKYVLFQYIFLAFLSLLISKVFFGSIFFYWMIIFLIMGVIYNVKPFRTKDLPFLDVLSESINNPLRLILGWFAITQISFPPSSIILSYWMGGAFLMAVKRYAEYLRINDATNAALYRKSFEFYDEKILLLSSFFYALTSTFFLGIFLIKYKIEFIIAFPFLSLLFAWYLLLGMKINSNVQRPEKLYKEKTFMVYLIFLIVLIAALFFVDLPSLNFLLNY